MKTFTPDTRKLIVAALLGPLAIVPALLLVGAIFMVRFPVGDVVSGVLALSMFGLVMAYPAVLVIGVPGVMLLRHFGRLSLLSLIGVALVLCLFLPNDWGLVLLYCYCATAVALGCWWVYKLV